MSKLTYDELKLPFYTNSSVAVRLPAKVGGKMKTIELTVCDVVYAAELAGLNMMFVSDTGRGKTQLVSDIAWHHFNGDSQGGGANWADGRPGFEIEDLFVRQRVDLGSGEYDSDKARQLKIERTQRPFFVVDELNRAPKPKQNEFFDLADGKFTFNGIRYKLGRAGYSVFVATANLNRLNGDFEGIYELDRALMGRAHLTFDLDNKDFRPTYEDKIVIAERKANPKVDIAEPKDISGKILIANKEIVTQATKLDPYMMLFDYLIDSGLDYCAKDSYKEKGPAWPMNCAECTETGRDLCSLIKASSERTVPAVKSLAYAFSYIAKLKEGKEVEIDPLEAALQAFRFTTYHGNLNDIVANEQYQARKQIMMDETVVKLGEAVKKVKGYFPVMFDEGKPVLLKYTNPGTGKEETIVKDDDTVKALRDKNIAYTETDLKQELKDEGIGAEWVDTYVDNMDRMRT
ncbi:hypothetical protein KY349_00220 [Candidatus Woesearchaeota archaeon]|nr:hypothetical protein [Candidatus Woesearchaeota archaeon]